MNHKGIKNKFLSKCYIFLYIYFLFITFLLKDSQLGGGIQTESEMYDNPIIGKIYYSSLILVFLMNIIIYVNTIDIKKSLFEFSALVFSLIFITLSLFHIIIITAFLACTCSFLINSRLVNYKRFVKYDFITRFTSILLIFFLYFAHLFPSSSAIPLIRRGSDGIIRYSLGFNHPNELGVASLTLLISGYLLSKQLTKYEYIINTIFLLLFYVIVMKTSESREFEIEGLIVLLALIFSNVKMWNYIIKWLVIPISFISLLLTIYLLYYMSNQSQLYHIINELSSDRLSSLFEAITVYSPKFTGYENTSLLSKIPVDNLYVNLLIKCGIVGMIGYEIIYEYITILIMKFHKSYLGFVIIVLSIAYIVGYQPDLAYILILIYAGCYSCYIK